MLVSTLALLIRAREAGYAIGAFNVYNLEGALAVVSAAEAAHSPVVLQVHPKALEHGGAPLIALCQAAADAAYIPVSVHLDHSTSSDVIRSALSAGASSIMADGSHLTYEENVWFTQEMVALAHNQGAAVEAELGHISGTEDGLKVDELEERMTDPDQAAEFVVETGVDALAVCIGNIHGPYFREPYLDFPRLHAIRERVDIPLVLHGASGLPAEMVRRCIADGVSKLNVNTEVRIAYLAALRQQLDSPSKTDLLPIMRAAVGAMQAVVAEKLALFGSINRA
jgi:tagatose 1,6-diphosphate aldolase GatY/KbaY